MKTAYDILHDVFVTLSRAEQSYTGPEVERNVITTGALAIGKLQEALLTLQEGPPPPADAERWERLDLLLPPEAIEEIDAWGAKHLPDHDRRVVVAHILGRFLRGETA